MSILQKIENNFYMTQLYQFWVYFPIDWDQIATEIFILSVVFLLSFLKKKSPVKVGLTATKRWMNKYKEKGN